MGHWEVHEWTDQEKAQFLAQMAALKAHHRANGCRVFDDTIARCTCPED